MHYNSIQFNYSVLFQEFQSENPDSKDRDLEEIEVKIEEHEIYDPLQYDFEGPDEGNFEVDDNKGY